MRPNPLMPIRVVTEHPSSIAAKSRVVKGSSYRGPAPDQPGSNERGEHLGEAAGVMVAAGRGDVGLDHTHVHEPESVVVDLDAVSGDLRTLDHHGVDRVRADVC